MIAVAVAVVVEIAVAVFCSFRWISLFVCEALCMYIATRAELASLARALRSFRAGMVYVMFRLLFCVPFMFSYLLVFGLRLRFLCNT